MSVSNNHRRLDLPGRTVFLTGAASGIGAAVARALVQAGASVALIDLHSDPLEEVAAPLGRRALPVAADVTDAAAMARAVHDVVAHFGSLDVCFANAGIAAKNPTTIAHTSVEEFERIIEVDLLGVWRTVRACLPSITDAGGHVLVTSSVYAFVNGAANAPYAMSKAAVESFGRSLRAELAGTGATAGVLYPGWVDTPIIAASHEADSTSSKLIELMMPKPLRTPVSADVVAAAAVRGIEARSPRVIVPRRWAPIAAARGLVNVASDAVIDRRRSVQRLLQQL